MVEVIVVVFVAVVVWVDYVMWAHFSATRRIYEMKDPFEMDGYLLQEAFCVL
jgi:hypothetical protein